MVKIPDTIRDGKGRGYLAGVNSDNQLITRATTVAQRLASTIDGNYYEATTGQITLSDATETGIIYLKNEITDGRYLVIDRVFFDLWASTGGADDIIMKYYKDVTITGGTDITPTNTNYASANTATGTFKKSLTTFSGTVWYTGYLSASSSTPVEEGRIVLPANRTHLITVQAGTANSSMKVAINVAFYYLDIRLIS